MPLRSSSREKAPAKTGLLQPETRAPTYQLPPSHCCSQSISKFCQFHLQNLFQICSPLSFSMATTLGQATSLSCLVCRASSVSPPHACTPPLIIHSSCTVTRVILSFKRQNESCQRRVILKHVDTSFSSNCSFGSRLCLSQIFSSGIYSTRTLGQMLGICISLLGLP